MPPGDVGSPTDGSPAAPAFCPGCGKATPGGCPGCLWEYDPPHYCTACGLRLAVNVSPNGWKARCKTHGDVAAR